MRPASQLQQRQGLTHLHRHTGTGMLQHLQKRKGRDVNLWAARQEAKGVRWSGGVTLIDDILASAKAGPVPERRPGARTHHLGRVHCGCVSRRTSSAKAPLLQHPLDLVVHAGWLEKAFDKVLRPGLKASSKSRREKKCKIEHLNQSENCENRR